MSKEESKERKIIDSLLEDMLKFFHLNDIAEISGEEGSYYITMYHCNNDRLFYELKIDDCKDEFIERIVGYTPGSGVFPEVHSIHDLYLVIIALHSKCRAIWGMGYVDYVEGNNLPIKDNLSKKDYKLTLINTPSTIKLNFNY